MFNDIFKRLGKHTLIYLILFYIVPYISILISDGFAQYVISVFVVILNLFVCIGVALIDTYKYKSNYILFVLPGLLFIPSIILFNYTDLYMYSILYVISYAIGMMFGWAYKSYGIQLYKKNKAK